MTLVTGRQEQLARIADPEKIWDVIIIGGGATGLGAGVDAASRGLSTLLLEQADYAKGTSSRSTKLVHGGVRYLANGEIGLVKEALFERGLLLKNAAHLVNDAGFIIPGYSWWGGPFYWLGLTLYDLLAGRLKFGHTKYLSAAKVTGLVPGIQTKGLRAGVLYHDGQFDDARLAINLCQTCIEQGGTTLNYFRVGSFLKSGDGKIAGVEATDRETGKNYKLRARAVINATGVFADQIQELDEPGKQKTLRPSQGVHIVLDRLFLPGKYALMIPSTEDGRVLFVVPWHNALIVGTTDTRVSEATLEPVPLDQEVDFILRTVAGYLERVPAKADIKSKFAGLRPLAVVKNSDKTREISRSHKVIVSASGLVSVIGGKWTTYRKMGQDAVDQAMQIAKLQYRVCKTKDLPVHGSSGLTDRNDHLYVYGSDREAVLALATENTALMEIMTPELPYIKAEVVWAARFEMARTVEDVLARRLRALFLDARASIKIAPLVAGILACELGNDSAWASSQVIDFEKVARNYVPQ